MENLNDHLSRLTQEADKFLLLEKPQRSQSLRVITQLFNNMNVYEQESAISILNEKVFSNFDVKSIDESCKIKDLKLFGGESTSEVISKKDPLTIQEIRLLSIFIEEGDPKEQLKDLKSLVEDYKGDLNQIYFQEHPLISYVMKKNNPDLIKYILPKLDFLEELSLYFKPRSQILSLASLEMNKFVLDIALERGLRLENEGHMVEMIIMNPNLNDKEKIEFFEYLREKGFDFDAYPEVSPLATAIQGKSKVLFDYFLDDIKVDINKERKGERGVTPLSEAIKFKNYECLELLLERGVDTSTRNCGKNLLPFEYACALDKDQRTLELLAQYKAPLPDLYFENTSLSHLSNTKFRREHGYKEEAKILKNYEKMKYRSDKEINIKNISHSLSIEGKLQFSEKNKEEKISLQLTGLPGSYKSCKTLAKGIEKSVELIIENKNIKNRDSYEVVEEALLFTSKNPFHEEILGRFNQGAWTLVETGYSGHGVVIVLKKDPLGKEPPRLFLCNRGGAMRKAVQCFTFDEDKLSIKILKELRHVLKEKEEKDYEEFIFEELPERLNLQSSNVEKKFEDLCKLEDQTVGNCAYASPEMASKLVYMANIFEKEGLLGERIFSEGDKLASQLNNEFEEVRRLISLKYITEYLDLHEDDKFPYPLDEGFVKQALLVLWSGRTTPLVKKELENIEGRFFKMVGEQPKVYSLYKIQKCYYKSINYVFDMYKYVSS